MTYAEHASVCWICEDMIRVGDRIVPGSPRWIHAHCDPDREAADPLRQTLEQIRRRHRPDDLDERLCREGCACGWPCDTYEAADYALAAT